MKLLIFILILSINTGFAQKTLVFKIDIKKWNITDTLKIRQQSLNSSNYLITTKDSVMICENVQADSIMLELKNHISYSISGLTKINSDTILIENIKFYSYIPKDTIIEKTSKKKLFKKELREKEKITIYYNSKSLDEIPNKILITINGAPTPTKLETSPTRTIDIYCTPGKYSYSLETIGIFAEYKCIIE